MDIKLKQALERLQQAQETIAAMVAEQEAKDKAREGRPTIYMFVYEQHWSDADEWGPSSQGIQAYDIEEAFCTFGFLLKTMGLAVRNIRYGLWSEMQEEEEHIREYWRKQRGRND